MFENTYNNNYCSQKLSIIQTCPGNIRFGPVKTDYLFRPSNISKPRVSAETKRTRNAIGSRVHRISAQDDFAGPVSTPKCVFCGEALVKLQNTKVLLD